MAIGAIGKHGCDIYYLVTNERTGQVAARAKTGMLFFDYQLKKLSDVPRSFMETIRNCSV
ncbi:MAG: thioesterase family protein [Desulfobacterales bacterium]|nr:thioesterase family protein [Desulfobacterales bacterium]